MKFLLTILTFICLTASAQTCYDIQYSMFTKNTNLIENDNTTICYGNSITLSTQGLGQQWCSEGFTLTNGKAVLTPTQTTTYKLYSIKASGNLVVNSNFNLGETGFSSDYGFGTYNLYPEGNIMVGPDPKKMHSGLHSCVDHTTGNGNMLMANGGMYPNMRVWYQKFQVIKGNTYTFKFWAQNISDAAISKLYATADGIPLDTPKVAQGNCNWQEYTFTWKADRDSVTIAILDKDLTAFDNDFALDDISFSTISYDWDDLTIGVIQQPRTTYRTINSCDLNAVPGIRIDTLRNSGCDTLYTITTTEVTKVIPVTQVCPYRDCNSYTLNGITYTKSTTRRDTLKTTNGCDSLFKISEITIDGVKPVDHVKTINSCGFYQYGGFEYHQPTKLPLDTIRTANGCDSVFNFLFINIFAPTKFVSDIRMSCEPITYNGKLYTKDTTVIDSFKNVNGCDSLVYSMELLIGHAPIVHTDTVYTCNRTDITKDTLRNERGCDIAISIVRYIAKLNVRRDTINKTICAGDVFTTPSGLTLTDQGTYRDTIKTVTGCDSAVSIIYLKVNQVFIRTASVKLCPGGYAVTMFGDTLTKSGTFIDTVHYKNGCDSLIKIITVEEMVAIQQNISLPPVCDASLTLPTGEVVTQSGLYRHVIASKQGCDSVVKIFHVTFKKFTATVSKSNDVNCQLGYAKLKAMGGVKYDWQGLGTGNEVTVTPRETTTYKVNITNNKGCTYTDSVTVKVDKTGAGNIEVPNAFTPNNDGKNDCYSVKNLGSVQNYSLSIFNRWGNVVFQSTNVTDCWDGKYKGVAQDAGTFVYQLKGESACGTIDKKGTIILIR
jgi:gliding motility-associated-like protein